MSTDVRVTYYESLFEVHDLITNGPDAGSPTGGRASKSDRNGAEWYGNVTVETATDMLLYGWPDMEMDFHEEVEVLLDKLHDRMNDFIQDQHRTVLDVSGAFVDIDRYISGEPENMIESFIEPDVSQGKALKVLVSVSASSGVDPERIKRRGLAVAAAVHAVTTMGFNVELWVGQAVGSGWQERGVNVEMIKAKDYFDPIDDEVALFMCAHPAMLRRIVFWLEEQHESRWREKIGFGPEGRGYGTPCDMPEEVREQFDLVIERGTNFDADELVNQLVFTSKEERLNEYR